MHGGVALDALKEPDPAAVERGLENLAAHLDSAAHFGKPTVVAINQFGSDTPEEIKVVHDYCASRGVPCATADVFGAGGGGAIDLAEKVVAAAAGPADPAQAPLPARLAGRAEDRADRPDHVWRRRREHPAGRRGQDPQGAASSATAELPICMAKTQDSLSDNPKLRGRPRGFTLTVRDIEIAAGAGFLVALTGEIVRMPGLPERPAAERIDVDARAGSSA